MTDSTKNADDQHVGQDKSQRARISHEAKNAQDASPLHNSDSVNVSHDAKDSGSVPAANTASAAAQEARSVHVASNISSSMSGNVIGDMVGNKRMNLLDAMQDAKPQVGRRPEPVNDPWPRRKMFIRGILLGLLVCIVAVVLIIALSQSDNIATSLL